MKKSIVCVACALLALLVTSCGKGKNELLLSGSGWNKMVIVDKKTKEITWEYPLQDGWECNSVAFVSGKKILFSYSKGARLISLDKETIWDIPVPEKAEMQTAKVLDNGNFLLAWGGFPATILEVTPKGEIVNKTEFELPTRNSHAQFRQVNINKKGNYMVPFMAGHEIREISPAGELLKTVKVPGNPFSIAPLENGNWVVACGDRSRFIELDFDNNEEISRTGKEDIEGVKLFFVAQIKPTAEGGLYICNWQGHGGEGSFPQLIELDANKKVIWSLNDNAKFGMISAMDAK